MTNPKDNAVAEHQNSTIKNGLLKDFRCRTLDGVRRAVGKAIEFYNEHFHMSLNNLTPFSRLPVQAAAEKMDQLQRETSRKLGDSRRSMYLCATNPEND